MEKRSEQRSAFLENKNEPLESNLSEENNSIPRYSEKEASALAEKLTDKETFKEAQRVLITWLKEGQCDEGIINLVQICLNHFNKLQKKVKECPGEIQKVQEGLEKQNVCIHLQLKGIEEIFNVISNKEDIWNNFTPDQQKKIQEMLDDIIIFKEDLRCSTVAKENSMDKDLKKNNVTLGINAINHRSEDKELSCKLCENEILKLNLELKDSRKRINNISKLVGVKKAKKSDAASQDDKIYQKEMHIISLISIYLFQNPDGVFIEQIHSFIKQHMPVTGALELENLMTRFRNVFKESPIEETQKMKWTLA